MLHQCRKRFVTVREQMQRPEHSTQLLGPFCTINGGEGQTLPWEMRPMRGPSGLSGYVYDVSSNEWEVNPYFGGKPDFNH